MDAQPKPGTDTYREDLLEQLEAAQASLLEIGSQDCSRADTQIARCVAMQRIWDLKALIAIEDGREDAARKASSIALDYSKQQTAAKKGRVDDKLNDLDERVSKMASGGRKLRAVGS